MTRYQRIRALGRCWTCGESSREFSNCASCRAKTNTAYVEDRAKLRAAGVCVKCGHASTGGRVQLCLACARSKAATMMALRMRRADAGVCQCGAARTEGYKTCAKCRARFGRR